MSLEKSSWLKGLAIVIVIILVFIFTAPATLVSDQIQNQSQVQVSGISGKLLNGTIAQVHSNGLTYENLSWNLNVLSSLSGSLNVDLLLDDPTANLTVTTSLRNDRHWQFKNLTGQMEIEPVAQAIAILSSFGIGGELSFNAVSAGLDNQLVTAGSGSLSWNNGLIRVNNQEFQLGQINAELSHTSDAFILDFTGTSSLAPTGTLTLAPAGTYELQLNIEPDGLPANAAWLANMGKREASGQVSFSMKGSFGR